LPLEYAKHQAEAYKARHLAFGNAFPILYWNAKDLAMQLLVDALLEFLYLQ
jgi:hypothetical protein